jgi:hypothetical protein
MPKIINGYYTDNTRLVDVCQDWYKSQGIDFDPEHPDKALYEKWCEYAFKDFGRLKRYAGI